MTGHSPVGHTWWTSRSVGRVLITALSRPFAFYGATFSGGTVTFGGATFPGGTVTFKRAAFSGGTVTFKRATLSGGTVDFYSATFSGGRVDLRTPTLWALPPRFSADQITTGAVILPS
jgi:hypothetical protein